MVLLTVSGRVIEIDIFILYLTSGTLLPLITPLFLLTKFILFLSRRTVMYAHKESP